MSTLKEVIKATYSDLVTGANKNSSCCGTTQDTPQTTCCASTETRTEPCLNEDYSELPGYNPDADYGLGCGLPIAFAGIKEGDTVLDLGSGAGNDVFVAHSLVGENGKVIGIDMTPKMIKKANENKKKLGLENIEFILGDIEQLPIKEEIIDVAISNCVLNLVSDKLAAYKDIYRVLKKGGHFSISDIVVSGQLTKKLAGVVELYAGCISGAMEKNVYINTIKQSGFKNVNIKKEKVAYLPDSFLLQHLNENELVEFRSSNIQVLSITVNGEK